VKKLLLFLAIGAIAGFIAVSVYYSSQKSIDKSIETELKRETNLLEIKKRKYKVGFSGYFPANFPKSNTSEVLQFYKDIDTYAEVYGVHTNIEETNILKVSSQQQKNPIVFVTALKDGKSWKQEKDSFIKKLDEILAENKQIKYLGIGNEINFKYDESSQEFNEFVDVYLTAYQTLKTKYPEVKIFTIFQYETLKGKGYLTGRTGKAEWAMLQKLESKIDVIGITLYPHFDYHNPEDIPLDYFSELRQYSVKPIIITETGWLTRTTFSNNLDATGFVGSESEQEEYLKRLVKLLENERIEILNWFSLNDFADWKNTTTQQNLILFDSFGFRTNAGEEKNAWKIWKELVTVPYENN
jgi:hypothetical protein